MSKMTTRAEEFLFVYNKIDRFMRKELNKDERISHTKLIDMMSKKNKLFNNNNEYLKSFARLRNAIVHESYNNIAEPIAEPHEEIITQYKNIMNKVMEPDKALDTVAVQANNIFTANLEDDALEVMKKMQQNTFTHVPVLENNKLIGIFSENTIFSYIVDNEALLLGDEIKIKEFEKFIPLDMHESEIFKFVSKDKLLYEVEDMFEEELRDNKRLSVIFITESGKTTEKILGMITAWDIAGYKE